MLNALILVIQIASSVALIVLILLHAGRGGGLSDMFGGGSLGGSMAGSTVVERNLDRITVAIAIVFLFSTVLLAPAFAVTVSANVGGACGPAGPHRDLATMAPCSYERATTSEWRNRQTRQLEGLVPERVWGFKSPLRHAR